ncbi:unnamed protein product [Candidula unifasciata]|uniref:NF-X1-type domain-containing protein n=1 Tax=Candidula unifasciata TaxID=100452 RepID=A0A8S3ZGN7_9EUPU|nr:unnamed protein product [Candidula unifasciata]
MKFTLEKWEWGGGRSSPPPTVPEMGSKERKLNGVDGQYDSSTELHRHGRDTGNIQNDRSSRFESRTDVPQEQRAVIIGRSHQRNVPKNISHDVLKTWVDMQDAGQLILTMTSELPQLEVLLNQAKISDYMIDLLVDAISHALTAQHQKESIRQLLDILCKTKFMGHLTDHLKYKEITKETWNDAKDFFTSYLRILKEILDKLPQYAHICASKVSELSQSVTQCESIKTKASLLNEITELTEKKPFIRAAEIEGGYKNIQHYLDVQFRLMREDFIYPLRDAIVNFKQAGCKKYFNSSDVKCFCAEIFSRALKRFIFGSLLCLSKDDFESAIFAIVTQCDKDKLAKGIVIVNFKTGLDEVFSSTSNDMYIMAQTTAYFESYCHVLEGLQEMVSKLPLQDYILHCKTEIKPPQYLLSTGSVRRVPRFDLSCLTESKLSCKREAAQLALTKELAIIQGPPGTGKTYVGLKIMQVLLENKDTLKGSDLKSNDPILVVCYTNHALDQFLEGVLNLCPDGIVRVGGQSKSEKLQKFNLTELKQNQHLQKAYVKQSVKESSVEMDKLSTQINQLREIMESLETEIISETLLEAFIKPSHYDSLVRTREQINNPGQINLWLRTDNNSIKSVIPQMIKEHLTTLVLTLEIPFSVRKLSKAMKPSLEKMSKYLTSDNNEFVAPSDGIIESWLLGLNKHLKTQLDDVEFIMNHNKKLEVNNVYFDDVYNREQNDRMVDDDGENVATNEETQSLGIIDDISTEQEEEEEALEEWKIHMKPLHIIKVCHKLRVIKPASEETEKSVTNVWNLEMNERFSLYNLWIKRYKQSLAQKMHELVNKYTSLQEKKQQAKSEETLYVLRHAKVIGMTTSGAARLRGVLQAVGCRIIVVEEAAEVLESHIVTSLNENCKHLILIGDHQQLRPKTTVYQLAIEFGLEISLFERLIKNKVPHVMLKEQHRMRPEISQILRHIYPDLQDHPSVTNYEKIRGVSKNIFFIQHDHKETHLDDSMSKANAHEAKFLVAMYRFLLKQGYNAFQITMLATYAGQISEIYKTLDTEEKEDVNLTTVDNYQGEENDIILLSLVRSNAEKQTGFLKVDNRVCVALSRAKKGLYVIGNFDLLASQSKLWSKIVGTAKAEQIIGTGLPVICEKHPDFQRLMTSDKDFEKCREGGCGRLCQFPLLCGHTCTLTCHGYDPEHLQYKCKKACNKKCEAGHSCIKLCNEACGKCYVLISKIIPLCGHEDQVACSLPAEGAVCAQRCEYILDCEHRCSGKCGQCRKKKEHTKCTAPASYKRECGHTEKVACHLIPPQHPCNQPCGAVLQCGHICQGTCVDCLRGAVHVACEEYCEKKPCGHPCREYCGVPCSPCKKPCPFQCRHGSCFNKKPRPLCGHACEPCMENCLYGCKHGWCSKKCSENCDVTCKQSCDRVQNFQRNNETQDKCSGLMWKALLGKQIKNGPLIKIPTCNHVFFVGDLDDYVYGFGHHGTSYIQCPKCEKHILKCRRYEAINKSRSRNREAAKKKLVQYHSNLLKSTKMIY